MPRSAPPRWWRMPSGQPYYGRDKPHARAIPIDEADASAPATASVASDEGVQAVEGSAPVRSDVALVDLASQSNQVGEPEAAPSGTDDDSESGEASQTPQASRTRRTRKREDSDSG